MTEHTDIPVSASLVLYNNAGEAELAVDTFYEQCANPLLDLWVVDNGDDDGALSTICARHPQVHAIRTGKNLGFGGGHNLVVEQLSSKYHAFINPDIVFDHDTLGGLVSYMEDNPDVVLTIPRLVGEDGIEQNVAKIKPHLKHLLAGRYLDHGKPFTTWRAEYTWSDRDLTEPVDVEVAPGAFFVIRTDVLKAIDGFDERFFLYFEDFDMGLRSREHGRVVYVPQESVQHRWERGYMSNRDLFKVEVQSMFKFFGKWGWGAARKRPRA